MRRGRKPDPLPETIWECHALIRRLRGYGKKAKPRLVEYPTTRPDKRAQSKATALAIIATTPDATLKEIAERANWYAQSGRPYKMKACRILKLLRRDNLVIYDFGIWIITDEGRQYLLAVASDNLKNTTIPQNDVVTGTIPI